MPPGGSICTQTFVTIGPAVPDMLADRQTHRDRQTDGLITILRTTTGRGGVIKKNSRLEAIVALIHHTCQSQSGPAHS